MKTDLSANFFSRISMLNCAALLLLFSLSFSSDIVNAEESLETARKLSESGQILPLEKIIASAKTIKPGEFLEIELERKKKTYFYEVEILDANGQVWELTFNAKSGKLIELEHDD